MHFIIGGAYQGKRDYAKTNFLLTENQIYTCSEDNGILFDFPCIDKLEEFTLWCIHNEKDPLKIFQEHSKDWEKSVLICTDIFCGVVPMGADMRTWREETGKLCAYLSAKADSVTRMFSGLPQKLK